MTYDTNLEKDVAELRDLVARLVVYSEALLAATETNRRPGNPRKRKSTDTEASND